MITNNNSITQVTQIVPRSEIVTDFNPQVTNTITAFSGTGQRVGPIADPYNFLSGRLEEVIPNPQPFDHVEALRENLQTSSNLVVELQPAISNVLVPIDENALSVNLGLHVNSETAANISQALTSFNNRLIESIPRLNQQETLFSNLVNSISQLNPEASTNSLYHFFINLPPELTLNLITLLEHNPVLFLLIARTVAPLAILLTRGINFRGVSLINFITGLRNIVTRSWQTRRVYDAATETAVWRASSATRIRAFLDQNIIIGRNIANRFRRNAWFRNTVFSITGLSVASVIFYFGNRNRALLRDFATTLTSSAVSAAASASTPSVTPPRKEDAKDLHAILVDLLNWLFKKK